MNVYNISFLFDSFSIPNTPLFLNIIGENVEDCIEKGKKHIIKNHPSEIEKSIEVLDVKLLVSGCIK